MWSAASWPACLAARRRCRVPGAPDLVVVGLASEPRADDDRARRWPSPARATDCAGGPRDQRLLEAAGWTVEVEVVKRKQDLRGRAAPSRGRCRRRGRRRRGRPPGGPARRKPVALGIVPMGTGNLLAEPGGPGALRRRCRSWSPAGSPDRRGSASVRGKKERFFSVACGVGFDAEVMDARRDENSAGASWPTPCARSPRAAAAGRQAPDQARRQADQQRSLRFLANFGGWDSRWTEARVPPDDGYLDVMPSGRRALRGLISGWEALRRTARHELQWPGLRARAHEIRSRRNRTDSSNRWQRDRQDADRRVHPARGAQGDCSGEVTGVAAAASDGQVAGAAVRRLLELRRGASVLSATRPDRR